MAQIVGGGKCRHLTRGFCQLQSHYLFAHYFCRPDRGNEKGMVEGLVKFTRLNFFARGPSAALPRPGAGPESAPAGSYSQRDMVQRRPQANHPATKQAQTFILLDVKTRHPLCLANASSARQLSSATQELLALAQQILPRPSQDPRPLLVADGEHFTVELLD
jgi:hypothetical protein